MSLKKVDGTKTQRVAERKTQHVAEKRWMDCMRAE
jgi:hypothetical protein